MGIYADYFLFLGYCNEYSYLYYSLIKRFNNPISRSNARNGIRRYGLDKPLFEIVSNLYVRVKTEVLIIILNTEFL